MSDDDKGQVTNVWEMASLLGAALCRDHLVVLRNLMIVHHDALLLAVSEALEDSKK